MRRFLPTACVLFVVATSIAGADIRKAALVLTAALEDLPTDAAAVTVWVPIPTSTRDQQVSSIRIDSDLKWKFGLDEEYGNAYIFTTIEAPLPSSIEVEVHFVVERSTVLFDKLKPGNASQEELRRNLLADRLVTISPGVRSIANDVTRNTRGVLDEARALYDHVVETMTYDVAKPGWGTGDTERALKVHSGDCADFHSLFISLARARGIPARFVIGMDLPRAPGDIVIGYHCWSEFYLQARGWVPIDASDASKTEDPAVRNFLFGNLHFDRIQLTVGRDVRLDPPTSGPLNFMVFPYAETDGRPVGTPSIRLQYGEQHADRSSAARRRQALDRPRPNEEP